MDHKNICTKREYEKNGEKKTTWMNVGTLSTSKEGKQYINLNMFPDTTFFVFEPKEKEAF
jgi:hypothetical protein